MDKKRKEKQSECGIKVTSRRTDKKRDALKWEKPTLEDVSGRVMAQPYIRFT